MKETGVQFELPYQERMKRHGAQIRIRLHKAGVKWWDQLLEDYEPMPRYIDFPGIWTNFASEVGQQASDFPMWALIARSMQYSWGPKVGLPLITEVADNFAGHKGVIKTKRAHKTSASPMEIKS